MTLTVRALPTPHDPPAGPVTVATPSCCCCCCCCLATLGTAIGFAAGASYETAVRRRRHPAVPIVMAVLALPLALAVLVILFNAVDDLQGVGGAEDELAAVAWFAAIAVYLGLTVGALRLAGAGWAHAVGASALVAVCIPAAFLAELFVALFTAFIVELVSPAAVVLGIWIGRRTHRDPAPTPWPAEVWIPPGAAVPPALPSLPLSPPSPSPPSTDSGSPDDPSPGLPALPRDAAVPDPSPEDDR